MPELRRDPITKNWSIIATERAKRPESSLVKHLISGDEIKHDPACFFCEGNEHATPPEVLAYRDENASPDLPGWNLRVVPNKFAALNFDEDFLVNQDNPLKITGYARGAAEVLIESPHHTRNLALQSADHVACVLMAYRNRYLNLSQERSIKYISIFRNNGQQAGASLVHPHSQIMATPVVPINITNEMYGANDYYESTGRCVYCDIIKTELKDRSRIICENENFIAFAPYASRTPFETWVMPKFHSSRYQDLNDFQIHELSEIWKSTLYKIYTGLENPPYNYFIHTSPTQKNVNKYYHWHMELVPKLTIAAGFELGTGMYINIAIPEDCADYLRSIEVK
ncbi:MAG: galactose-1-phosphate uridylyltransferase [Candidatus Gastranaerophilales bacterium]|nr:galactose-1-phosphate uridylyltransferase [Candidatus Gastranaerophilales bacterium]